MIKLLDQNELIAVREEGTRIADLEFDDRNIVVYLYEALSIAFDLSDVVWQHSREKGILVTSERVKDALDKLYFDAVRVVMKDLQKDLASLYQVDSTVQISDVANESPFWDENCESDGIILDACEGEGTLEEDE